MTFKKILIIYLFLFLPLQSNEQNQDLIEIYKNLRCLICQGQSVADSNSDFATTIKLVVQDQIQEGKTEKEIYEFLISKYGEWIVYQPSLNKNNFLLWFLPYFILVLGGLIIFIIIRKSSNNKVN
ncbi:cytochrome c-type biogenesis protein CcmH [Pelagibacteraceae bacterium]|nr:cytochrome c-type biogenesis protein CcmH [Pelagibacteraceae bacterium]|tara:strand:+ start:35 stop:409 length:375 start_codon:yes stop_codon:yes gene_type:complete